MLVGKERGDCLVGAADDVPGDDRWQHAVLVAMDHPIAELAAGVELFVVPAWSREQALLFGLFDQPAELGLPIRSELDPQGCLDGEDRPSAADGHQGVGVVALCVKVTAGAEHADRTVRGDFGRRPGFCLAAEFVVTGMPALVQTREVGHPGVGFGRGVGYQELAVRNPLGHGTTLAAGTDGTVLVLGLVELIVKFKAATGRKLTAAK